MACQDKTQQPQAGAALRRTQMFTFTAPYAKKVQVVGDFTHWSQNPINLTKDSDGIWRGEAELESGTQYYRFLVDGDWHRDPACGLRTTNTSSQPNYVQQRI